jgi:uncharacterized protein (TIGR02646 family)
MRYIDKTNRCVDFDNFVAKYHGRLRNDWEKFKKVDGSGEVRLGLHQHLWKAQKALCAYCEQEIPEKKQLQQEAKSHFEHIRPKALFPKLTYEFNNLIASCEGFDLMEIPDKKKQFCGHFKTNDQYDDILFLNPTEIQNIEQYFSYDSEGGIRPNGTKSSESQKRAAYMIEVLGLNHKTLRDMRKSEYDFWDSKKETLSEDELSEALADNLPFPPPFLSLLRQRFLNI